uniref:Uncharacterized protein n=1 Tax=Fagus sylvatica TaxID=28930 RepID=A0A2N9H734_FAGSY
MSDLSSNRPGLDKAERIRPRSSRSRGIKAKFEKARIEAEEMLDAAEVNYMCFEFLSSACGLMKPKMAEIRLGDAEKINEAEVAFDRPWMCRARRERSQGDQIYAEEGYKL